MLLDKIASPADLRGLSFEELELLAAEIREFIVEAVAVTGGHLGSNLGAVELTLAIHRVFESPRDVILWDTGHQAYVHKIVTGRRAGFDQLRQDGGLSGYPNRQESEHDWVENSHASTILSYAHGLATALETTQADRKVIAVIGDGAMTGGMAYEALNNLGASGRRVVIVLNDNGRSYAPTVGVLTDSISRFRLNPNWTQARAALAKRVRDLPAVGEIAYSAAKGLKAAIREVVEPHAFFEALGVRYAGPIDGHDLAGVEEALRMAGEHDGPVVVHLLTQKGRGYPPAEDDDEKCLHDAPVFDPATGPPVGWSAPKGYTQAFSDTLIDLAADNPRLVAITAAMPGPTGLLPFQTRWPDRYLDVGIAEQHAVTAAAGMAMGGLRPVVAVYSTFFSRAFDQANLDVGLHGAPVVFALDRAGITGDDGPSHHGLYDMALCLQIPGMTVFAPSSLQELGVMLRTAVELEAPASVRYPKGAARQVDPADVGTGLQARLVRDGGNDVCILAVGKMLEAAEGAAAILAAEGTDVTVWDVRVVKPLDPAMVSAAADARVVVTVEDGVRVGGAGSAIADAVRSSATESGRRQPHVVNLGVPSMYISQAPPAVIHERLGLDAAGIAASVRVSTSAAVI